MLDKAEKMKIIDSADQMIGIRDLRNQIAHEYIPEAIRDLVPEVIDLTSDLLNNIEVGKQFIGQRGWLNSV